MYKFSKKQIFLATSVTKKLDHNKAKDRQMEQLNQTIVNFTETINELKRKIFGISSEKSSNVPYSDGQLSLFGQLGVEELVQEPEMLHVTAHEKKNPVLCMMNSQKIYLPEQLNWNWKVMHAIYTNVYSQPLYLII